MKVAAENQIAAYELRKGNTVYIESYCLEMEAFENQLKKKKERDA